MKPTILSTERAKAVYTELLKLGIEASRLSYEGKGEKKYIASNDSPEGKGCQSKNKFYVINPQTNNHMEAYKHTYRKRTYHYRILPSGAKLHAGTATSQTPEAILEAGKMRTPSSFSSKVPVIEVFVQVPAFWNWLPSAILKAAKLSSYGLCQCDQCHQGFAASWSSAGSMVSGRRRVGLASACDYTFATQHAAVRLSNWRWALVPLSLAPP